MNLLKREFQLLDLNFKALHAAILVRLAAGMSITQTAKDLEISRTTIYKLKKHPDFQAALLAEIRYQVTVDVIEQRCLAYRRKLLKAVIRHFSKLDGGLSRMQKFKAYLDKIDTDTGMI